MGESPDRSNRTAGAEEKEAERTPETPKETGSAQPVGEVEPEQSEKSAAPSSTDTPTRALRALDAEAEEAAAGAVAGAETAEAEEAEAAAAEAEAEPGTESEPESGVESGEAEADAGDGEPSEPEQSPVESATRVLRAPVRPEAAAAAEPEDEEAEAGEDAEPAAEGGVSAVDSATRVLRAPAKPEAAAVDAEADGEADAEEAPEAERASAPVAAAEPELELEDVAEDSEDLDVAEGADDADDTEDDDEDEEEPPAAAGPVAPPAPRSVADEETRAMAALPPFPPSGGSGGSGGASALSRSAAPGHAPGHGPAPAPARGVPAGATAVAETPETTVEAMEVLAALSAKPMTPMRIALRRVRLWGTLLVLLVLVLGTVQLVRPLPQAKVQQTAAGSYAFEGGALALQWPAKGQAAVYVPGLGSMGHSGSGNPVPLASVTKMMTAYIVLRDHPLKKGEPGPTITVDQQAVNDYNTGKPGGESVQKVTAGEQLSEYQALQMLMIPSANNIARLLGRWDAGNDAAFVQKMQATAAQLGMTKSTYTDPSGLTATTRSTADDQLKLATAAMADPVFREVVGTQQFNSPQNGLTPNTNTLVGKNGVIGIKTGSSTAALGNLVWAAEQRVGGVKQLIVGVTLSQPAVGTGPGQGILDQVLATSKKLVLSAEQALQSHTVAHKGEVVGYLDDGLGGRTAVVATQDVQVAGWSGLSVDVSLQAEGKLPHSAAAGTVVGQLVVGSGATAQRIPVALQSDLAAPGFGAKLTRLA